MMKIKIIRITLYKKTNERKLVYFAKKKEREKWVEKKKVYRSHIIHHSPPRTSPSKSSWCSSSNAIVKRGI
jgi:hypothetical protein